MESSTKQAAEQVMTCEHKKSIPPGNFAYHMHNEYEIFLLLRGEVSYVVEKTVYLLQPDDILIFNDTEFHHPTFRSNQPFERIVLHFNPEAAQQLSTMETHLLHCFIHRRQGDGNLVRLLPDELQRFRELALLMQSGSKPPDYGDDVITRARLSELLVLLNRAAQRTRSQTSSNGQMSPYVGLALEYIHNHLTDEFSLAALEKAIAVNRYYLSKIFRREMGMTLYHYLLLKRLNLARSLLSRGCTVADACSGSGFNDYCNFIRLFRKYTGVTPAAFARRAQR